MKLFISVEVSSLGAVAAEIPSTISVSDMVRSTELVGFFDCLRATKIFLEAVERISLA